MENGKEVCYLCDSAEIVGKCKKCGKAYCAQCASKQIPLLYCFDCMANVEVKTEDPYIQIKTDYDLDTGETIITKSRCKRMQISGPDWFFHERYMSRLSEEELRELLEICRHQVIFLESEIDAVNVRRRQEQIAQVTGHYPHKVIAAKVREKKQPTIQDIHANLQKLASQSGLTIQQLVQMMGITIT